MSGPEISDHLSYLSASYFNEYSYLFGFLISSPICVLKILFLKQKMDRGRVGQTWEEDTLVFPSSLFPWNLKTRCMCLTDAIQNPREFVDTFEEVFDQGDPWSKAAIWDLKNTCAE